MWCGGGGGGVLCHVIQYTSNDHVIVSSLNFMLDSRMSEQVIGYIYIFKVCYSSVLVKV